MPKTIFLQINSSGCLTTCRHCWAQSKPMPHMPLADVESILQQFSAYFTDNNDYQLIPFPMFEELAHPKASQQLKLFRQYGMEVEPLPTSGIALAIKDDWQEILSTVKELEIPFLVLSFHGIGEVHDRAVNRKGAYNELLLALQRIKDSGLDFQANVFITKESAPQIPALINDVIGRDHQKIMPYFAHYSATSRARVYEKSRVELADLTAISETLMHYCGYAPEETSQKRYLSDLEQMTEAALVKQALNLSEEERIKLRPALPAKDMAWLTVTENFDLYTGHGNFLVVKHGNLKTDDFNTLMISALAAPPFSKLQSCFSTDISQMDITDLAKRFGDPNGQKIYYHLPDIRNRWLDQALVEYRRY